jgi:hypothetical protein
MDGYVKSLAEGLDAPVGEGGGALRYLYIYLYTYIYI